MEVAAAQRRDQRGFPGAFGAEAMVHGRGLDSPGKGGVGEEQQSEAVRTAGHGDADPLRFRVKRLKVTPEAGDEVRRGAHAPS